MIWSREVVQYSTYGTIGLHSGTSQSAIKLAVLFHPVLSRIGPAEPMLGLNSVMSQLAIKSAVGPLWSRCDVMTVQPYSARSLPASFYRIAWALDYWGLNVHVVKCLDLILCTTCICCTLARSSSAQWQEFFQPRLHCTHSMHVWHARV